MARLDCAGIQGEDSGMFGCIKVSSDKERKQRKEEAFIHVQVLGNDLYRLYSIIIIIIIIGLFPQRNGIVLRSSAKLLIAYSEHTTALAFLSVTE